MQPSEARDTRVLLIEAADTLYIRGLRERGEAKAESRRRWMDKALQPYLRALELDPEKRIHSPELYVIWNEKANFLAIAYSKAAEMADTLKNSGNKERAAIAGEFGYMGGVIKKVNAGYILAVFSGASGEQDVELATEGLDWLNKYY